MTNKLKPVPRATLSAAALAYITLQRAADQLGNDMAAVLRPYGLSLSQYNVLRILRGARPTGLPSGEVGNRMIAKDPDVTRLLDRMEKAGWVERERLSRDRRVVIARISKRGLTLVNQLDAPINARHQETLGRLGDQRLSGLITELEAALASLAPPAASD